MRRFPFVGLLSAVALTGACSLLNSPDPVQPGGEGGGGATSSSTTATGTGGDMTTSSSSSGTTGGGGAGGGCDSNSDCASLTKSCVVGVCNDGVCEEQATDEGKPCDDGAFCTVNDKCKQGTCGGTARTCPGSVTNTCLVGQCDEAANMCTIVPGNESAGCDDLDPCTIGDTCAAGVCTPGAQPKDCSVLDGECAVGKCSAAMNPNGGCYAEPINQGAACDVLNTCATSTCDNGFCMGTPIAGSNDVPCDDQSFCTVNETCQNGECKAGAGSPCASNDACGTWSCDEVNDTCQVAPIAANVGQVCTSFVPCFAGTKCVAGICSGGAQPPKVYFYETFKDNAKGWLLGNEWQIGPAKNSPPGTPGFNPDPDVDHTQYDVDLLSGEMTPSYDNGVAGVKIGDNATPQVHGMSYLESPLFDTSGLQGSVILSYHRWLNTDYPASMPNVVQVQNGQGNWITVWQTIDKPNVTVADNQWLYEKFDITAHRSNKTRVRFGFAITKATVFVVSSWNIDDVLVASTGCP